MSLLVWLALAAPLAADAPLSLLGRHEIDCPACTRHFTTVSCTQTNSRGGVDRDLFARALGPQPEFYRIHTCPQCAYSGYLADFDPTTALPPDFRDRLAREGRQLLPAGFGVQSDPRELDAADRYRLAIECYTWRQRSDEALGWLHLRAAWVAREEGSAVVKDDRLARVMGFIERWRPPLPEDGNQADVELTLATHVSEHLARGEFNRFQQPYVELALAVILRRHGELRQAGPALDRLSKYEPFSPALHSSLARIRDSITREREHLIRAADHFERALLAGQIAGANQASALYLMGEICRRLDRDREAVGWFDQALKHRGLPAELKAWATEQRAWAAKGR